MSKRNSIHNRICEVARCERLMALYKEKGWTARANRLQKHIVRVLAVDLQEFSFPGKPIATLAEWVQAVSGRTLNEKDKRVLKMHDDIERALADGRIIIAHGPRG